MNILTYSKKCGVSDKAVYYWIATNRIKPDSLSLIKGVTHLPDDYPILKARKRGAKPRNNKADNQ